MFAHFSAAVCHNERIKWVLLDDFQDFCVEYDSMSDLLVNNDIGWFFRLYQQKGKVAGTSSDVETSLSRTSVDCHQTIIKGSDDGTVINETRKTTDKSVLRDQQYFETFSKGQFLISKESYKETN